MFIFRIKTNKDKDIEFLNNELKKAQLEIENNKKDDFNVTPGIQFLRSGFNNQNLIDESVEQGIYIKK